MLEESLFIYLTCQASSSWDSTTLCLMVLRSCTVIDSFSCLRVINSLSKELEVDMMISIIYIYNIMGSNEIIISRQIDKCVVSPVAWLSRTASKGFDFLPQRLQLRLLRLQLQIVRMKGLLVVMIVP